jgi:hypothetical protein
MASDQMRLMKQGFEADGSKATRELGISTRRSGWPSRKPSHHHLSVPDPEFSRIGTRLIYGRR